MPVFSIKKLKFLAMKSITEDEIEQYQLQLLHTLGYAYSNGYDIQPEGKQQERESFGDVILIDRLTRQVARINPTIPPDASQQAIREIFNGYRALERGEVRG